MQNTLSKTLKRLVKNHPVLTHPFVLSASKGQLNIDQLRSFALQESFVSLSFPTMMAEVICKIPFHLEEVRYPLITNLFEEAGEYKPANSHPSLLRKLAVALGAKKEEIESAEPLPETVTYLEKLFALCRSNNYLDGLAAIGYGNEFLVLFEYPPFKKACKQLGLSAEILEFFDVNIKADVAHAANIDKVILLSCSDSVSVKSVIDATIAALDARQIFYDGLIKENQILGSSLV